MGSAIGFFINRYVSFESATIGCGGGGEGLSICRFSGWPFRIPLDTPTFDEKSYLLNFLFWLLSSFFVSWIILSLVRWGRYRSKNPSP